MSVHSENVAAAFSACSTVFVIIGHLTLHERKSSNECVPLCIPHTGIAEAKFRVSCQDNVGMKKKKVEPRGLGCAFRLFLSSATMRSGQNLNFKAAFKASLLRELIF